MCPNGHAKLEKVPILYGLLSHLVKAEKDRTPEERDLARQIKRREIIWGGCCIGNDSPDHLLRCQQCGFEWRSRKSEDMDFWTRNGTTPGHFKSFSPYAQQLVGEPGLRIQSWRTDQQLLNNRLTHEQVSFELAPPVFEASRVILSKWANDLHLPDSFAPPALEKLQAAPFLADSIRPDHHYVRLVMSVTENGKINVTLIVCHEEYASKWVSPQPADKDISPGFRIPDVLR